MADGATGRRVFRSEMSRKQGFWLGLTFGFLAALFGIGGLTSEPVSTPDVFGGALFAVIAFWSFVRGPRVGVVTTEVGVRVVNPLRSYDYRWDDIQVFETIWNGGPRPDVVLKDGSRRRMMGIGGWIWSKPESWKDQALIDELNDELSQRRKTST